MLYTIILFVIDKKTKMRKMISGSGSSVDEAVKEIENLGFLKNEYKAFINESFYVENTYFFENGNNQCKEVWFANRK